MERSRWPIFGEAAVPVETLAKPVGDCPVVRIGTMGTFGCIHIIVKESHVHVDCEGLTTIEDAFPALDLGQDPWFVWGRCAEDCSRRGSLAKVEEYAPGGSRMSEPRCVVIGRIYRY